ncbi:chemotaxis protein [Paenibacillus sp. DR312]|uniref:chemotaxis protein n=1 Tax=Paenibacillus sp. DR312 TaxID=2871175 RepID=UPI001C94C2D5|nr:chemotaxis protein [Paenibacillus sp. DR312]QZN75501.1 chemotaxis protein [Paenibacillus sp. DR312]
MSQKVAVIVIHGLGKQHEDFASIFIDYLLKTFTTISGEKNPESCIEIKPVWWASVFAEREEELKRKLVGSPYNLRYVELREFMIHYLADAVAYQPLRDGGEQNYEAVHQTISKKLNSLSTEVGPDAPLCVISHSLGSVIASNFFYDLQHAKENTKITNPHSALERGETLSLFYTCGTTLPLWSLRYTSFDRPIQVPSKEFSAKHPTIAGEWINFYDKDDVLGYPLKSIHLEYDKAVNEDRDVNVGTIIDQWTPLCHNGYLQSNKVIKPIAEGLFKMWKQINH